MTAAPAPSRRLSAMDGTFLRLESPSAHMHVGFSAIFSAPPGAARPTLEQLRRRIAARLHLVPRCRQRLAGPPLGLGEPCWIDDPRFDLDAHVTGLADPGRPVSAAGFAALRDDLLSEPLDRARSLWQLALVPHLAGGGLGVVGKVHHAMADGVAALRIGLLLLDAGPEARGEPAAPWTPEPLPPALQWAMAAARDGAGLGRRALGEALDLAGSPRAGARRAAAGLARVVSAAREDVLHRAPASFVNRSISPRRVLVGHRAPLAGVRAARHRLGATVNDVALAAVTGALRELALQRGEEPRTLRAMVPVNVRPAGHEAVLGNRIAMVFIGLPLALRSPRARLERIRQQTVRFKQAQRPAGAGLLMDAAGMLPAPLRGALARAAASPRFFNLTVSSLPGPDLPVHMFGARLEEVYPVVPIAEGHALAIGIIGYRRELFFGIYADPGALPEVWLLPALLDRELHELAGAPRRRASRIRHEPAPPAPPAPVLVS